MGVAGTSEHVENSSCTMSDAEERKYGEVYEYLLNKSLSYEEATDAFKKKVHH